MASTSYVRSQEPAPARATIILGFAAFGAVLGFILASVIGLEFLGFELPDADGLPTVALVGAGWGWALGAQLGDLTSSGARQIEASTRRGLRIAALASVADVIAGSATLLSASRTHEPVSDHRPPS